MNVYHPEVFLELLNAINAIEKYNPKTTDPGLKQILALWDQDVTVTGDVILDVNHRLNLPKNLTVKGNFGRFALPRTQKVPDKMPERLTCEDYVFRYESPFPSKTLNCKTISFSKEAKLPETLPEIIVRDGLAGIQKEFMAKILAQAPKGFVPLTKGQVKQNQSNQIMDASRKPDLTEFSELINELPLNKRNIEALDKEGNYKAITIISKSSKMALAKFSEICKYLEENRDIEGMDYVARNMNIESLVQAKLKDPIMQATFFNGMQHNESNSFTLGIQTKSKYFTRIEILGTLDQENLNIYKENGWRFHTDATFEALEENMTWFQKHCKAFSKQEMDMLFKPSKAPWHTKDVTSLVALSSARDNLIYFGAMNDWRPSAAAKEAYPMLQTIKWETKPVPQENIEVEVESDIALG